MTDIDKKIAVFEYLLSEHLPTILGFGEGEEELSMFNESLSEIFKQAIRSSYSISAQIMSFEKNSLEFINRSKRIKGFEELIYVAEKDKVEEKDGPA